MDPFLELALGKPGAILPEWLVSINLLRAFLWYITAAFLISFFLRVRFYYSVYHIARHISYRCPNLYQLIHEHKLLLLGKGLISRVASYGILLLLYFIMTRFVCPLCTLSIADLGSKDPAFLVYLAIIGSLMVSLDAVMIATVSRVDTRQIIDDLSLGESWLGGNVNRLLNYLGKWNPIKWYADSLARTNITWLNDVFQDSLELMTVQLCLRLLVAGSMFGFYLAWAGAPS